MEFAVGEREPRARCLELGIGLRQPDFVGARIDREEEIALMDDVPILEVYSGERAADLGAQLDLLDRGELTKKAQPRIDLAHERLADDDLRKGRRSRQRRRHRSDDTSRRAMQSRRRQWLSRQRPTAWPVKRSAGARRIIGSHAPIPRAISRSASPNNRCSARAPAVRPAWCN